MDLIKSANLAFRFLLELSALAAAAYWGATSDGRRGRRIASAVVAPLAVAVVWVLFVAPGATIHTAPIRLLVELVVFGTAVAALYRRRHVVAAAALGSCYALNRALMAWWDQ